MKANVKKIPKDSLPNNSAMRKLIPATSMLLVSAVMLASSTYAWFTMSKEVSLTGIQMTASVPEDIQVSLGLGTLEGHGNHSLYSSGTTGAVWDTTNYKSNVGDPAETAGTTDWSNAIAVGSYYTFGHLTPATSMTGTNIFYTHDATGVGKTIREDFSTAIGYDQNAYTTFTAAVAADAGIADPTSAHSVADTDDKTGGKYYIDIPVWFRTSVKGDSGNIDLAVIATFSDPGSSNGDPSIVKAARVALLDTASSNASAGVICDNTTSYYHTYASSTLTDGDTPVCTSNTWATTIASVSAATSGSTNSWGNVTFVKQATTLTGDGLAAATDTTVVTVPKATGTNDWGTSNKYILRVWLEGEYVNCWNETAAQDFQIDLRFIRKAEANP